MDRYFYFSLSVDLPLSCFSEDKTSFSMAENRCLSDSKVRKQPLKSSKSVLSEFDTLVAVVIKGIQVKVTPHQLSVCVRNFASILNSQSLQNDIQSCNTVQDIFNVMIESRLIKFHNLELLEKIIDEYLEEHKPELEKYKLTLKHYFNLRICELDVYESGKFIEADLQSELKKNNLIVVADKTWGADDTVERLFELTSILQEIFGCSLELVKVVPGSLCISFSGPLVKLDSLVFEKVLNLIHFGVAELRKTGYEYSMEIHCKFFYSCSVKHVEH